MGGKEGKVVVVGKRRGGKSMNIVCFLTIRLCELRREA